MDQRRTVAIETPRWRAACETVRPSPVAALLRHLTDDGRSCADRRMSARSFAQVRLYDRADAETACGERTERGRRRWSRLSGCSPDAATTQPPPSACFEGEQVGAALRQRRGEARRSPTARRSRAASSSRRPTSQLQDLGLVLTARRRRARRRSAAPATRRPRERLGYLVGAAGAGRRAQPGHPAGARAADREQRAARRGRAGARRGAGRRAARRARRSG